MASINGGNSLGPGNRYPGTNFRHGRFAYGIDNLPKNFQQYNGEHLPLIKQELLRQLKPKELTKLEQAKDLDTFFANLTLDETVLSPEALAYLRNLRQRTKRQSGKRDTDFRALMGVLSLVADELEEELAQLDWEGEELEHPHQPIQLSKPLMLKPREPRAADVMESEREEFEGEISEVQELAHKMIAYSPRPRVTLRVIREIEPFGLRSLYRLYTFGLRIIILERGRSYKDVRIANGPLFPRGLKTHVGSTTEDALGLYIPRLKVIVMHEHRLGSVHRSTLRHEMAHAWEVLNPINFGAQFRPKIVHVPFND